MDHNEEVEVKIEYIEKHEKDPLLVENTRMSLNPSSEQMDAFLTFLEEHSDLARCLSRDVQGRNRSRQLWAQLTNKLNALGGCMKNTKQWQKVWADKKYLAKKAATAARQSAIATGGEPSFAQLSARELRIVSLIKENDELETDAFPETDEKEDIKKQPRVPSNNKIISGNDVLDIEDSSEEFADSTVSYNRMSINPTSEQMDAFLTFLEEHRDLARGHSRDVQGRNRSRQLWAQLTDDLNALGGCTKNTKQWQKVWADKKYLAKKAAAIARQSAAATGGEASFAGQLSARELRIVSLIEEDYDEPETDAFPETDEKEDAKKQPRITSNNKVMSGNDIVESGDSTEEFAESIVPYNRMSINPTSEQMDAFLTFLEEHRDLARGHSRDVQGRHRSRQLWAQLTDELNALGGCTKNTKQWQKVWADKKYLAKKAAVMARQSAAATGGEASFAGELSARELRIVSLIEDDYDEPESDAFPENPHRRVHVVQEERTQHAAAPAPPSPARDDPQRQHHLAEARRVPHQHHGAAVRRRFRRRRSEVTNSGLEQTLRGRLFNIEEQRVAAETRRAQELSLIRQSLQQLCTVMRNNLQELSTVTQNNLQEMLTELRTRQHR